MDWCHSEDRRAEKIAEMVTTQLPLNEIASKALSVLSAYKRYVPKTHFWWHNFQTVNTFDEIIALKVLDSFYTTLEEYTKLCLNENLGRKADICI